MTTKTNELTTKQILAPLTDEQLNSLTRNELFAIAKGEQKLRLQYEELMGKMTQLEALNKELQEQRLLLEDKYIRVKSKLYSPKSEKCPKKPKNDKKPPKEREKTGKSLRERYPNAQIIEKDITLESMPSCQHCSEEMIDSGMVETSEYLTVIPKQYLIVRNVRHKYRCSHCHGDIQTAPALPRVVPGSSYSDELIIDATLSKFCDLIPMERYCAMAKRLGIMGLPPHSLIGLTHKLAEFLSDIYKLIKMEVLSSELMLGDETKHKMLEGDEKKNWYLWCFSSLKACFFEHHDTRAGEVASEVLIGSMALYFMSDAYCGYTKAIRLTNEWRGKNGQEAIKTLYCNAHARRGFSDCLDSIQDAQFFIDQYAGIYKLEKDVKQNPEEANNVRTQMKPYFEKMKEKAKELLEIYSSKSHFYGACNYFLKYYDGLTLCLENPSLPLDNNHSEGLLRSPVVGRKTWYGTHSKEAAITAAVHFTIVGSCKLAGVNPRQYYQEIIKAKHQRRPIFTPNEFAKMQSTLNNQ